MIKLVAFIRIMALQIVFIVTLIICVSLSASQSCGSLRSCSQVYDANCPPDHSCDLYDNTKMTQSSCSDPVGPTPSSARINCYDTCIQGDPVPLRCCADSISMPDTISLTRGSKYLIARLTAPAQPNYRLNTFCKYNIQCPNEAYNLYYTMIRFSVEPPDKNGKCLDFMRYQFTATGASVPMDLCGKTKDLSEVQKFGVHGSGLTLDFRSNRINTGEGFFLALTCILPSAAGGSRRKRYSNSNYNYNYYNAPWSPVHKVVVQPTCTPSKTLTGKIVGRDSQDEPLRTAEEYFEEIFPTGRAHYSITVPRGSVVKYERNSVVVERNGRILYRFRRIRMMQVYNRIEGYRTWRISAPAERTLPGYGFLRIGRNRIAQCIQTIIDPKYLLSDEEELILHDLFEEIFVREKLDNNALSRNKTLVNCSINRLAKLNKDSCSDAVRAVANFFLDTDTRFQDFCDDCDYN